MPVAGAYTGLDSGSTSAFASLGNATQEDLASAARETGKPTSNFLTTLVGDAALGVIDTVDTIASSIPLLSRAAGVQRGDYNTAWLRAADMPGLNKFLTSVGGLTPTEFYNQNRGGIEVASGIYGIVLSELAGRKIAAVAQPFLRGLQNTKYVKSMLNLDRQYANALGEVRAVDLALAKSGKTGSDLWGKMITTQANVVGPLGPTLGTTITTSRAAAANKVFGVAAKKGLLETARTEAISATLFNQNQFLYSADESQNMLWMGLGLGLGAGFEALGAGYQMRKFVNTDTMRRIMAGANDPTGQEAARLAPGKVDPALAKSEYLGSLRGWATDRVTSLMVSAKAQQPLGADKDTFANLATQHEKQAFEESVKATARGLPGITQTAFDSNSPGFWNHWQGALHKDPAMAYGAEMVGAIKDGTSPVTVHTTMVEQTQARITTLQESLDAHRAGTKTLTADAKAKTMLELKQLRFQEKLVPMVLLDQELMPLSHASVYDNFVEPKIVATRITPTNRIFEAFNPDGTATKVGIEDTGEIFLPKVKGQLGNLDNVDHFDAMRLFRAGAALVDDLARQVADPNFVFNVPVEFKNGKAHYNWFHLDLAEELAKRTDGRANINWGTLSRESAEKESLVLKIKALREKQFDQLDDDAVQKLRLRYNLPRLNSYEMGVLGTRNHPLDGLIRGSIHRSDDELERMSLAEFKQGYAELSNIGDLTQMTANDVTTLRGNSFTFMLDDKGVPVKPILLMKREIMPTEFLQDRLAERLAIKKAAQAVQLVGPESGPIVRELVGSALSSADYQVGTQVGGLIDTQIASSLPGLANNPSQTVFGAIRNSVVTAERRAVDNPVILAVTRLRKNVSNRIQGIMRRDIESNLGQTLATLNGPRNVASRTLLDNLHSFRSGWNLEAKTVKSVDANGKTFHAFVLSDTVENKSRWKKQFGTEMQRGQTLVDSRGKEIVLDDVGLAAQEQFNKVTDNIRIEKNSLLRSQGLPEVRRVEWYTPPPNVQGKYIGFVFNSAGEVVPGGTIVAATQKEFDSIKLRMESDPTSVYNTTPGAEFKSRDQVAEFASIWDKAQMDMMNPGTTAVQGGKQGKGGLTGTYTDVGRFNESMTNLREQYLSLGDDIMSILLSDSLKAAKSRANFSSGVTRNADSKQVQYRSIHDYWVEAATGRNPISSSGSVVGSIANPIENAIDGILAFSTPSAAKVWSLVTPWFNRANPWAADKTAKDTFERLTTELGKHNPFESTIQMMELKHQSASPLTLKDIAGAGNRFTATWALRMVEPAMAVMNMAGVVNAIPAVVRHISAKAGESSAEVAARVGHNATIFTAADGTVFSTLDMGKVMMNGFKRAWAGKADAKFDRIARKGMVGQEVMEFQKAINSVKDRGAVTKFFHGDTLAPKGSFAEKGVVGWASILTDKSEDFTRLWSHMAGDEIGRMMGIVDDDALDSFADDFANKVIANYSPENRAEIFQGGIGSVVGLFQSFMVAYYQRMFRYIETGDKAALATQYATQATLFGGKTVPGFSELNDLFFEATEGEESVYDSFYRRFGQSGGDMLMAGTLSNLPKMFGAPGVDLSSRGDTTPRIVQQNPLTQNAAVAVTSKVLTGIAEGVKLFAGRNPDLNDQQVGEVLSNMIPNRPIAGFIELALAGGYDTDHLGQVVNQTTTWMEATYRMMGLRSLQQSKSLEAFYANKQAQEISGARQEHFNTLIRGSIRNGDPDAIPKYIESYLDQGGDPRQVRRMIKRAYDAALNSRSERQLDKVLGDADKMSQVTRLLDAGIGIGEELEGPDPTETFATGDSLDNATPTDEPPLPDEYGQTPP